MTKNEKLYDYAHNKGICIINASFSETKKAACLKSDFGKVIVLDKMAIKSQQEEREVLAEEIGHFATNALYIIEATANTNTARSNRIKYEAQAKRWAIRRILPVHRIKKAFDKGLYMNYEVADELDVSTEFLAYAMKFYISKGELSPDYFEGAGVRA